MWAAPHRVYHHVVGLAVEWSVMQPVVGSQAMPYVLAKQLAPIHYENTACQTFDLVARIDNSVLRFAVEHPDLAKVSKARAT